LYKDSVINTTRHPIITVVELNIIAENSILTFGLAVASKCSLNLKGVLFKTMIYFR